MNKKELSEEDIKNRYITPALNNSGWNNEQFRMELRIQQRLTDGKISLSGHRVHRESPKFADYVLYTESNYPIAIVEAKDNKHSPDFGLQQAMNYAIKLDIPFAYSSNGDSFIEHDFLTSLEREIPLNSFPTREELLERLAKSKRNEPSVKFFSPEQEIVKQSYYSSQDTFEPRYYQRVAINRTLNAVANGQKRILLVMATGTGKTYTAFQIIWRLLKSNTKRKILYLADRNILVDQSIGQDFKPLEKSIHKINFRKDKRETIGAYDVYFSLYQQLADREEDIDTDEEDLSTEDTASRLEQLFSRDFFDLVIVDECHRGSAKEASNWHNILKYFDSATQIGMTATPKETSDVSNISYFGEPVYTYSLKEGIDDGFLAPFRVIEETTNITEGWRPSAGQVDENGIEIPDRIYTNSDFDKSIVLRDRTREVAQKITDYLKSTDRMQKTIVFCPTEDAANRMRRELVNLNSDEVQKNPDYIVRITGSDKIGKEKLDYFISVAEKYPVIATTSKLLSTGVDCKMVKLIVLDEVISSMTEFKQIIGRGTRLRESEGKTHFVVMDFRGNTKQFADPKWDGPIEVDPGFEPGKGGAEELALVDGDDIIVIDGQTPVVDSAGCPVRIIDEEVKVYDFETGKLIRTENIDEYIKRTIVEMYPTVEDFSLAWKDNKERAKAEKEIETKGINLVQYREESNNLELDYYDLLRELVYDIPAKSRYERVRAVRESDALEGYDEYQYTIINLLLDKYIESGLDEITNRTVLKLDEFVRFGNPIRIAERFGGILGYSRMMENLVKELCK